jgi:hypothetical protein
MWCGTLLLSQFCLVRSVWLLRTAWSRVATGLWSAGRICVRVRLASGSHMTGRTASKLVRQKTTQVPVCLQWATLSGILVITAFTGTRIWPKSWGRLMQSTASYNIQCYPSTYAWIPNGFSKLSCFLIALYVTTLSLSQAVRRPMIRRVWLLNWKDCGRECSWHNLSCYHGICPQGLIQYTINLIQAYGARFETGTPEILAGNIIILITLESKGFWRWCITLRITGFMDYVHRPEF